MKKFRIELDRYIKRSGKTQVDLASECNIRQSTISNILSGRIGCGNKVGLALVRGLGLVGEEAIEFLNLQKHSNSEAYVRKNPTLKQFFTNISNILLSKGISMDDIEASYSNMIVKGNNSDIAIVLKDHSLRGLTINIE